MPPLRLLTYNVRYFGHRMRGITSQDRTLRTVARTLARLEGGRPDILCLQEIETHSLRADFGRRRGIKRGQPRTPQLSRFVDALHEELAEAGSPCSYQAFYFPAHTYKLSKRTNLYTTGLAMLVQDQVTVLKDNSGEPYDITHRRVQRVARWKQTRICGHLRLVHENGETLDVFNTHLSLPAFFTRDFWNYSRRLGYGKNQMEEAKSLVAFVQRERSDSGHTLVCGDFNSLPGSPVYRFLTREHGFRDAFRDFHALDPPHSRDYPTAGIMRLRLPIDYVFSCDGVEWIDFDETHTFGLALGDFHGLSDHVPLVARCRLPGNKGT